MGTSPICGTIGVAKSLATSSQVAVARGWACVQPSICCAHSRRCSTAGTNSPSRWSKSPSNPCKVACRKRSESRFICRSLNSETVSSICGRFAINSPASSRSHVSSASICPGQAGYSSLSRSCTFCNSTTPASWSNSVPRFSAASAWDWASSANQVVPISPATKANAIKLAASTSPRWRRTKRPMRYRSPGGPAKTGSKRRCRSKSAANSLAV